MDSVVANGAVESSAESPAADMGDSQGSSPAPTTKGRGLRRWRRIPREHHREGSAAAGSDEDSAQLHKRRLPLAVDAPKGKHEVAVEEESSTAFVQSRFIPQESSPAKLDPDLGLLIASTGFSVGAVSDNSEDRSSKSSTTASAPRHDFSSLTRERAPGASLHGKNPRAARARADRARARSAIAPAEVENSRSSVESDLRSSNAVNVQRSRVGITGNGIHRVLSDGDDHSEEGQPSEEVRSTAEAYYKENESSVVGRLIRGSGDSDDAYVEDALDEGSVGKGENGLGMHSGAEPYAESILLLHRTQEALENEIRMFVVMAKESSDDFDVHDDEWSDLVHLEEPVEELIEKIKDLESRLEEASALIKEKDSRILELEALSQTQARGNAIESTNLPLLQSDLDQLLQDKMEAEIQCIILTRASQTWTSLAEDQMALYKVQKSLSGDYKQLEHKLRHTENRAMMLEEMAEKLEAQCKELARSSEVLQLQSRASRVSLFCFVQSILLFIAIGTFLMRLLPSSTEVVPT